MPSPARIRVVLAMEADLVLSGVQSALAQTPSIDIVGEARDGATALALACQQAADVLLLTCSLAGILASDGAAQVREAGMPARLLVLGASDDEACLRAMLALGAAGYVATTEPGRAVVAAVRAVARGQPYFSLSIQKRLAELAAQAAAEPGELDKVGVTEQEQAILEGLARGWDNARIARTLSIAERTVRYHLRKIKDKAGIEDRTELAVWAIGQGLGKDA